MVLAQRIDTVRQFILAGHQVSVTYSYSTVAMKIKSKVMVSAAPNVVAESYRPLLLASIEPLLAMSSWCVTVDRGHTYSDGHCCANFWMQPSHHTWNNQASEFFPAATVMADNSAAVAEAQEVGAQIANDDGKLLPSQSLARFLGENFAPPPAKRTRFGTIVEEVIFFDSNTHAPTTLDDFIADVHAPAPTVADMDMARAALDMARAALTNKCMEAHTLLLQSSKVMQNMVTDSRPFLPHHEHQTLMARCV